MIDRISCNESELKELNKRWSKENLVGFVVNPSAITYGNPGQELGRGRMIEYADFPVEDLIELQFRNREFLFESPLLQIDLPPHINETVVFSVNNFFWKHPLSYFNIDKFLQNGYTVKEPFADDISVKYDNYTFRLKSVSYGS